MGKWQWRSGLYKTATVLTYFVFLVYGLAFSVPAWMANEDLDIFQGLWMKCVGSNQIDFDNCSKQAWGDDWGLCGAAGVILTTVKIEDSNIGYDKYYWGFMIACIASGLAILLAIVLLIARNSGFDDDYDYEDEEEKRRHGSRAIDYVNSYGKQQQPYPGYAYGNSPYEYHNAGYKGDNHYPGGHHDGYNPPLGNGVSYHHQPTPAQHPYTMYQGSSLPRHNGGGYRHSMAESADLSNGFTPTIIHAEQTHLGRGGPRGDYYMNGSRPY
ncbi:hypothetical protein EGW08_015907 [Elysia chlorotica]|uniref:Claudin n=1 Tax=Elysia chlorotica TaxID=188477 RepID=A0A433T458_ELYCH|nr:hypothetical protein EGW08_015907 [Elysia chlorotica]